MHSISKVFAGQSSLTTNVNANFPLQPVQSSDCVAWYDGDGNPISKEPKTSFMFPLDLVGPRSQTPSTRVESLGTGSSGFGYPGISPYPSDTFVNGYTCPSCGTWVPNGIFHSCGQSPSTSAPYGIALPRIELKPHKCPVCEGKGQVSFDPEEPLIIHRDRAAWPCKPCGSTGVLWQ